MRSPTPQAASSDIIGTRPPSPIRHARFISSGRWSSHHSRMVGRVPRASARGTRPSPPTSARRRVSRRVWPSRAPAWKCPRRFTPTAARFAPSGSISKTATTATDSNARRWQPPTPSQITLPHERQRPTPRLSRRSQHCRLSRRLRHRPRTPRQPSAPLASSMWLPE